MSYRRRAPANTITGESHIRGPTSALTGFLREHGINDDLIRRRQELAEQNPDNDDENQEEEEGDTEEHPLDGAAPEISSAVQDQDEKEDEELQIRIAARRKRRLAKQNESDYTDSDDDDNDDSQAAASNSSSTPLSSSSNKKKMTLAPGMEIKCYECPVSFKITAFSRKVKDIDGIIIGYLCKDCAQEALEKEKLKREKALKARKRRKKVAEALLDKQELKFPSLQDLCVKLIIKYIDDVEQFGDIGTVNLLKICQILCKNRLLSDASLQLFLNPEIKDLELFDCSKLNADSLKKIAAYCPNLSNLSLQFAARLNDNVFDYYIDRLDNLTSLHLNGSFLIFDDMWKKFFEKFGKQLKSFTIKNSYRFTDKSIDYLVSNCQVLELLTLSRLDGVISPTSYGKISQISTLRHLEISFPTNEGLVTNDSVIQILDTVGPQLETLVLDGCSALTDDFLVKGIKANCLELKKLSLKYLDQITNSGFQELFTKWDSNAGLMSLDLQKCVCLGDDALVAMIHHLSGSLIQLDINSIGDLTFEVFNAIKKIGLPLLTTIDCGFVRAVDNRVVKILNDAAPQLKIMEVFGCNRCNGSVNIRKGLQIIGRQSDSI